MMTRPSGHRVLVGGFQHELNSFVPGVSDLDTLVRAGGLVRGDDLFGPKLGEHLERHAIAAVAAEAGVTLIGTTYIFGRVGPVIADEAYEPIRASILDAAREHRGDLDGVMLPLHGAVSTVSRDDTEGEFIAAMREIVGPDIPIVCSFDMHGHGTRAMADNANALIVYRTCPHIDYYETGERAMRILIRTLDGEIRPQVSMRKVRMTASSEHHDTNHGPMVDVQARARELEATPGVLDVSVFATQPWMDVPDIGWSVMVTTDAQPEVGQDVADELGRFIWDRREAFRVPKTSIPEALARFRGATSFPVVVSDSADTTTGGGNGDSAWLLEQLLADEAGDEGVMLTVTDEAAVERCFEAGVGAEVTLRVGGSLTPSFFRPVTLTGRVITLAEGKYNTEVPISPTDVRKLAVVEHGGIRVVLTAEKAPMLDQSIFHRAGLFPEHAKLVQVKSAGGFKAAYEPFAAEIMYLDTVGPADSDLTRLPFERITRPLWPWDADLDEPWEGAGA
jgi:microcystin degradation protein MlrC